MKLKYLNITFAIFMLAIAAVFFFYADTFSMLPGQTDIGPSAFPKVICILLAICAVIIIITEIIKKDGEKVRLFNWKIFAGIATAAAYYFLLKPVGFVLCSIVAVFVMELLMLNEPFKKAWPIVVSVAVIGPVMIQIIFGTLLKVPLPAGILNFIIG